MKLHMCLMRTLQMCPNWRRLAIAGGCRQRNDAGRGAHGFARARVGVANAAMALAILTYGRAVAAAYPPQEMGQDEQALTSDEIAQLHCLDDERKKAVQKLTGIVESEKVSRSKTFGYVFRYDMLKYVDDDGQEGPGSTLVLWTADCRMFSVATYSNFELPRPETTPPK